MLAAIRKAQRALCRLLEEAYAAGLKIEMRIDPSDVLHDGRVRCIEATATRTYK